MLNWLVLSKTPSLQETEARFILAQGPFFSSAYPLQNKAGFYRNNFELSLPHPWLYPAQIEELSFSELKSRFSSTEVHEIEWIPPLLSSFSENFRDTKQAIANGTLLKAVPHLTQRGRFRFAFPSPQRISAFINQLKPEALKNRYLFAWASEKESYVGLSPELLFEIHGKELKTMALAGTAPAKNAEELLGDSKEKLEHELVVEGLLKSLKVFSKNIHCGARETLFLGVMCHLKTPLKVHLDDSSISLSDLIKVLHPTPALGSYPRHAFQIKRTCSWLGSPFGYTNGKDEALFIAILRGLRVFEDYLELSTGCGVTENSIFERELRELALKRLGVRESFSI